MGSSCSILNDTEFDVWINHGVNWTVLTATVGGVAALVTGGIGALALGAGAGLAAGGVVAAGGALIKGDKGMIIGTAGTLDGLAAAQWSAVGIVTGPSSSALATTLGISTEEAEKIQKQVKEFKNASKLVKPGEKYTVKASLSLTLKYYVMNEKLQFDDRACFTGPTNNADNVYPISEYFQNLQVKRTSGDTYTMHLQLNSGMTKI